jgi:hypothetical protein
MLLIAAPEDGGGGGAEVAPADGRLHDRQVLPPGEDQREFPGILQAEKTFSNVVFDFILSACKRIFRKRFLLSSLRALPPGADQREFPVTASKEKTFCNVVFDGILSACKRNLLERYFCCRLFGFSHPERIGENFQVLHEKGKRFVMSSLMLFYLLVKGIYWKIFLLSSLWVLPPGENQREFSGTASKEKMFCNVVFDVILSACKRNISEDRFAVVSLGQPPPSPIMLRRQALSSNVFIYLLNREKED